MRKQTLHNVISANIKSFRNELPLWVVKLSFLVPNKLGNIISSKHFFIWNILYLNTDHIKVLTEHINVNALCCGIENIIGSFTAVSVSIQASGWMKFQPGPVDSRRLFPIYNTLIPSPCELCGIRSRCHITPQCGIIAVGHRGWGES